MKKNIEVLVDDLDEKTPAVKTVKLSVDGKEYTLDLGEKNLARLHRVLEPFTSAAGKPWTPAKAYKDKVKPAKKAAKPRPKRKNGPSTNQVRAWAKENGIEVGEYGRIKQSVTDAFIAAKDVEAQAKAGKAARKSAEKVLSDAA